MNIYLETDRMIFRELVDEDLAKLLDLDSDPEVMKYLTNGVPSTSDVIQSALCRTFDLYKKHDRRFGHWAAVNKDSGAFIGWFHFRPSPLSSDDLQRIELGYRLKKCFWGNGYATEGSLALLAKGFHEFGVQEVFAITMEKNMASRKVMERVGLKFLREFFNPDFPGTKEKDVEYAISFEDWKSRDQ